MPTRAEIKPQVVEAISAVTQEKRITESDRLWEDLGMTALLRKAMAVPYTKISKQYPGGRTVTQSSAEELETVGESIDLVHARANGKKEA